MGLSELDQLRGEELDSIPLVSISKAVLLPGALMPITFDEANHCRMVEDVMKSGRRALVLAQAVPESIAEVCRIAGAGRIVAHEVRDDGSHHIVVQGTDRIRIEEHMDLLLPYPVVRAERLPDCGSVRASELTALVSCSTQVARIVRNEHPNFALGIAANEPASVIADRIADRFIADPISRQKVLEEVDLALRVRLVTGFVSDLLALVAVRQTPS